VAVVCVLAGSGGAAASSHAAFPGANGRIAFVGSVEGDSEIYTVAADGSDERNHTRHPADDADPAFSPDGSRMAFYSFRDGPAEIYTMALDGSGVTRVTHNAAGNTDPAFSPDGSRIVFTSFRDGNAEIYAINADGSGQTRLTSNPAADAEPAFSPDGSKIVFHSFRDTTNPPQPEVYMMNADGTDQTRLTNNPEGNAEPAFSPDGSKVVFTSFRDGNYEIYLMNTDGSGQTRLTNTPTTPNSAAIARTVDAEPAFSPDGSKIAFRSTRDSTTSQLYAMNVDGTGVTPLTTSAGLKLGIEWGASSSAPLPALMPAPAPAPAPAQATDQTPASSPPTASLPTLPGRVPVSLAKARVSARQRGDRISIRVTGSLTKVGGGPCAGRVRVAVSSAGKPMARRAAGLGSACRYATTLTFATRTLPQRLRPRARRVIVKVSTSYGGNAQLAPDSAPSVRKRVIR